jgi:hypothetical protein
LAGIEYLAIFEPYKLYLYFKAYSPDLGQDFSLSFVDWKFNQANSVSYAICLIKLRKQTHSRILNIILKRQ